MTPVEVVARTAWGEARGEGLLGMVAVCWVIRNRVEADLHGDGKPDWWGEGYEGVCLARAQFSCWFDAQRPYLERVTPATKTFALALRAAAGVLSGEFPDPTNGATHYHTVDRPTWAKAWPPSWAATMPKTVTLDAHVFYRDPAAGPVKR